jgi:hypothetical protein
MDLLVCEDRVELSRVEGIDRALAYHKARPQPRNAVGDSTGAVEEAQVARRQTRRGKSTAATALEHSSRQVVRHSIEAGTVLSTGHDNAERRADRGDNQPGAHQGNESQTGPPGNAEP